MKKNVIKRIFYVSAFVLIPSMVVSDTLVDCGGILHDLRLEVLIMNILLVVITFLFGLLFHNTKNL